MPRRPRGGWLRGAWIAVTALAGCVACGSVGDPRPPLLHLPLPVQDLAAHQVDGTVEVEWTWPFETTEGFAVSPTGSFILWAVDVPGFERTLSPETIDTYRREITTLEAGELADSRPGGHIVVRLPLEEWQLGQATVLTVTAFNAARRHAGYSNQAPLHPLQPPAPVNWDRLEIQEDGVHLEWAAAAHAEEYSIERAVDGSPFRQLGRIALRSFLDRGVEWGRSYSYRIRGQRLSKAGWIGGALSPVRTAEARDTFPPSAPTGLRALRSGGAVELSWLPSPEEDVAGYTVVRNGEALPGLLQGTTFTDRSPPPDTVPVYTVRAVDHRGNESEDGEAAHP